ncbi:MAG TPA: VTT domain-containing protein [bacterium]|nr:VTT domain-containing protein [bacterium]HPI76322.1 VTT domain-containing protein [bacterium]
MKQYFTTAFWITFFGSATLAPSGYIALFIISFTESCCFIIMPDVLLPFIAFGKSLEMVVLITLWTSFASVVGACFGYLIGKKGGQPLLHKFFSREKTDKVETLFQKYDMWAIGIAAFTPIPYKVFTISAGVFNLNIPRFILVSAIFRTTRYMLIAMISFYFLNKMGWTPKDVEGYLHSSDFALLTVEIAGAFIALYLIIRFISKKRKAAAQTAA